MPVLVSVARKLGHQAWFAKLFKWTVPLDRLIGKLTKGKVVGYGVLPTLLLTTTGRRSGQPRVNPLLYMPDGDTFIVVGSNWGQAQHPAWALNLLANPLATVAVDGRHFPVRATQATGAERDRLWKLVVTGWPAYETYVRRASGRKIKIFQLERTGTP